MRCHAELDSASPEKTLREIPTFVGMTECRHAESANCHSELVSESLGQMLTCVSMTGIATDASSE